MSAILGRKLGMTSIFSEDGVFIPCTVIEAGPCPVVQIKTKENEKRKENNCKKTKKKEKKLPLKETSFSNFGFCAKFYLLVPTAVDPQKSIIHHKYK